MRVIAGTFRGRKLFSPKDQAVRPTSDRLRESVFNMISHRIRERHVLDLYAGTGALGIEALSRGASSCTFVDISRSALLLIARNLRHLNVERPTELIRWNIQISLDCLRNASNPFDLVFMDPPYEQGLVSATLRHLSTCPQLDRSALIVIEHGIREPLPPEIQPFEIQDQRRQRKSLVSFLACKRGLPSIITAKE
ncbi:MAG: 16S rRNA (guanine(966)-N(2))-methyltransferase RsmD [Desulfobacterales bacterium]